MILVNGIVLGANSLVIKRCQFDTTVLYQGGGGMTELEYAVHTSRTPDFYHYQPYPIDSVELDCDVLMLSWTDGKRLRCHSYWLRENTFGCGGIDTVTREGLMDPSELSDVLDIHAFSLTDSGDLFVKFLPDGAQSVYHSGWLRHIADHKHLPSSWLPDPEPWIASGLGKLPRGVAGEILNNDDALRRMLNHLVQHGVFLVDGSPTKNGFLHSIADRIGPIRASNFGMIWDVRADVSLGGDPKTNSTANTSLRLAPHTDLPTRETPPGFQFLHCLSNEVEGGESTLTDGAAIVEELKTERPDFYELLSTCCWIFFNRGPGIDHRFSAPIIDYGRSEKIPTIRAFYPVRAFPNMPESDVAEAYKALRWFHELADDSRFELTFRLKPGQIMCFDNRRIMHGRKSFSGSGARHLQGIYIDRDEIFSKARALNRTLGEK